jgi:TolB protein
MAMSRAALRRRVARGVVAVLSALALAATTTTAAPAGTFPGKNGRLAYVKAGDIFHAAPDGSRAKRLTTTGDTWAPAWSPDGKRIAFTRYDHQNNRAAVWVMAANGRNKRRLVTRAVDPDWSPDGKRIVFAGDRRGKFEIYVHTLATGKTRRVLAATTRWTGAFQPTWSPNGKRIALQRLGTSGHDLFTVRPDGTGLRRLTRTAGVHEGDPNWAPSGKRLAYAITGSACTGAVYTIKPDGSDRRTVLDTECHDFSPAWSPNGKRIALYSMGPDPFGASPKEGIWTVSPSGGRPRFVVRDGFVPDWQPLP